MRALAADDRHDRGCVPPSQCSRLPALVGRGRTFGEECRSRLVTAVRMPPPPTPQQQPPLSRRGTSSIRRAHREVSAARAPVVLGTSGSPTSTATTSEVTVKRRQGLRTHMREGAGMGAGSSLMSPLAVVRRRTGRSGADGGVSGGTGLPTAAAATWWTQRNEPPVPAMLPSQLQPAKMPNLRLQQEWVRETQPTIPKDAKTAGSGTAPVSGDANVSMPSTARLNPAASLLAARAALRRTQKAAARSVRGDDAKYDKNHGGGGGDGSDDATAPTAANTSTTVHIDSASAQQRASGESRKENVEGSPGGGSFSVKSATVHARSQDGKHGHESMEERPQVPNMAAGQGLGQSEHNSMNEPPAVPPQTPPPTQPLSILLKLATREQQSSTPLLVPELAPDTPTTECLPASSSADAVSATDHYEMKQNQRSKTSRTTILQPQQTLAELDVGVASAASARVSPARARGGSCGDAGSGWTENLSVAGLEAHAATAGEPMSTSGGDDGITSATSTGSAVNGLADESAPATQAAFAIADAIPAGASEGAAVVSDCGSCARSSTPTSTMCTEETRLRRLQLLPPTPRTALPLAPSTPSLQLPLQPAPIHCNSASDELAMAQPFSITPLHQDDEAAFNSSGGPEADVECEIMANAKSPLPAAATEETAEKAAKTADLAPFTSPVTSPRIFEDEVVACD